MKQTNVDLTEDRVFPLGWGLVHPQWVRVEINGGVRRFSGLYFTRAA